MSPASDWFAQHNTMSSIGTNPGKLCTSSLSLQRRITKRVTHLCTTEDASGFSNGITIFLYLIQMPDQTYMQWTITCGRKVKQRYNE